jgi:hypothetical protein
LAYEHLFLVSIKLIILFLGAFISLISYLAYRKTGQKIMLFISIGFGTYSLGTLVEGLMYEYIFRDYLPAHLIESLIALIGLIAILYGLEKG